MTTPTTGTLFAALEATWPAASARRVGPWMVRDGRGGGQRVSSTTAESPFDEADIPLAESAMSQLGQDRIFMIRKGDDRLDALLETRGYRIKDPVAVHAVRAALLAAATLPRASVFPVYPPLQIMAELWKAGGIGPERLAVMERAAGPKTALLARLKERPAGVAFVAMHEQLAILHAIHVAAPLRRRGVGTSILRAAARWVQDRGAVSLALAVTCANVAGNALYASNGMEVLAEYHYRTA